MAVLLAAVLTATAGIAGGGEAGAAQAKESGKFVLTCLDIPDVRRGAGLAVVLQLPSGKTCLYDTGSGYPDSSSPDGWAAGFNAGRDLIAPFLRQAGVKELDTVFISHAHYDHFGGLTWLAEHFPIKRLVDSGYVFRGDSSAAYATELADYDRLRESFKKRGAYQALHAGNAFALDDRLAVEVTAPPREFFTQAFPELRSKTDPPAHYLVNANSLGLRITHGKVAFLLPGDIQDLDQVRSLLPSLPPGKLKCDVLVAPGHGIHATREFAEATRPSVTFCSAFERYGRGIPAPRVFGAVGSKVYVTGLHGRLQATSDGDGFTVEVEQPEGRQEPR